MVLMLKNLLITQLIVKTEKSGICSSDIVRSMKIGFYFYPIIPGHEFCGTISDVGSEVKQFKKGDRVTYAKPSGERVHGQVLDRSGRSDYLFKADDISRVGSDRLLVNFDTLAAESEKYKKWREAKLEAERLKKERLRQQKKDIQIG